MLLVRADHVFVEIDPDWRSANAHCDQNTICFPPCPGELGMRWCGVRIGVSVINSSRLCQPWVGASGSGARPPCQFDASQRAVAAEAARAAESFIMS